MVEGWKASHKKIDLASFALKLKKTGFRELIYTDTLRDGTLAGPGILGIKGLLRQSGLRVIASGGISSLEDLHRLKVLEKAGLSGVIIGKALYEGRFTLSQALKFG
jgi:phosphoribosylformimino-5-aminoimidazole carboxamide ribotide isomerase